MTRPCARYDDNEFDEDDRVEAITEHITDSEAGVEHRSGQETTTSAPRRLPGIRSFPDARAGRCHPRKFNIISIVIHHR